MTQILRVHILGGFSLFLPNQTSAETLSFRLQSLIAYLLLHRHSPQSRQQLAFLFWPDSDEAQARTNLRQLLYHLRQKLPMVEQFIEINSTALVLNNLDSINCDVIDFENALSRAANSHSEGHIAAQRTNLEQAANFYKGDLLRGNYEEWLLEERDILRQRYGETLVSLTHLLEIERAYPKAIVYANKLRQVDTLREETYRLLMRLHALNNDRATALKIYHECEDILGRELGVEPDTETRQQYEQLRSTSRELKPRNLSSSESDHEEHLIGRQDEWNSLLRIWKQTVEGQATLVNIIGEAGIGKTQLGQSFLAWAEHQGILTATAHAYAAEGRLAYAAIIDWLRSNALRETLTHLDNVWQVEIGRLLPELQTNLDPASITSDIGNWQKQRLFESIAQVMLTLRQPLLLLLDDLQWCDEESLDWIQFMMKHAASTPILIVATTRAEELTPDHTALTLTRALRRTNQFAEITLHRLNLDETAALVKQVAGQPLSADEINELYADTEGNPLFIVEIIRANSDNVEDTFSRKTKDPMLPPKVQAIIEERLAQLSPVVRDLTIFAAMLGREFSIAELTAATEYDHEVIVAGVDELWQRHIIREQDGDWYDFSHDKLREVALFSVSRARRRLYHLKVAQALEQTYANDTAPVSGRLAFHYEAVDQTEQAIHYYEQAAEAARAVFADGKAIQLFRKALDNLYILPENTARDQSELEVLMALGSCLVVSQGYSSQQVWRVYERAHALCEKLGEPIAPPILRALAIAYIANGEFTRTYSLGEQLLDLANKNNDNVLLVEGNYVLGVTNFWMGKLEDSRKALGQAIQHYARKQHNIHIELYAQDPNVICMCRMARTLWYLGYADQAVEQMKDCLALARVIDHPYSRSYALAHAGFLFMDMRDWSAAEDVISTLHNVATNHEFSLFKSLGNVLSDTLKAQRDLEKLDLASIDVGLETIHNLEARLFLPQLLVYVVYACLKAGYINEGVSYLSQAFNLLNGNDEYFLAAELYRLLGELERARGADIEVVTQHFTQALTIAQSQGSKFLELRAAMSLCQIQISLRNTSKTILQLRDVYNTFSEGFNTPDLHDAALMLSDHP